MRLAALLPPLLLLLPPLAELALEEDFPIIEEGPRSQALVLLQSKVQQFKIAVKSEPLQPTGTGPSPEPHAELKATLPGSHAGSASSPHAGVYEETGRPRLTKMAFFKVAIVLGGAAVMLSVAGSFNPKLAASARAIRFGGYYIIISSVMIESNKYLMQPGRFPHPFSLTFNHMLSGIILANLLRKARPSLFPALQGLEVTPAFCMKFLGLGVPFMLSIVCGNWAYQYLSVSFLQIMKQTNVITIYIFSVISGLESLRHCSAMLLMTILAGALMAIQGELHFVMKGFVLQAISSWSEAAKIVLQSFLMSGQAKLDPLTLFLFMAPACFVANLLPWACMEGPQLQTVIADFLGVWPLAVANMLLAFVLNIAVAQCIKEVSAVGFLLCGIVKDSCIIISSTIFLGESLAETQCVGFSIALTGVVLYSLYKQNADCFEEDRLYQGFGNVFHRLFSGEKQNPELAGNLGNAEASNEDSKEGMTESGKAQDPTRKT